MSTTSDKCYLNAKELLAALPEDLGFQLHCVHSHLYELHSAKCIVRLGFDQFEPRVCSTEFVNPIDPTRSMAYWVLRHIRGVPVTEDETSSRVAFGRKLALKFGDILAGDFGVQKEYEHLHDRILDRVSEVRRLPLVHPTRVRFANCDLQWLSDVEKSV